MCVQRSLHVAGSVNELLRINEYLYRLLFKRCHCVDRSVLGELLTSPAASNILKTDETDAAESAAVEYELAQYPIQMNEERQKQERRVSV